MTSAAALQHWLVDAERQQLGPQYQALAARLRPRLAAEEPRRVLAALPDLLEGLAEARLRLFREALTRAVRDAQEAFARQVQRAYGAEHAAQLLGGRASRLFAQGPTPPIRLGLGSPAAALAILDLSDRWGYRYSARFWRSDAQTRDAMLHYLSQHLLHGRSAVAMAKDLAQFAVHDPSLPRHLDALEKAARASLLGQPGARQRFLTALAEARRVVAQRKAGPLGSRAFQARTVRQLQQALRQGQQQAIDEAVDTFIERRLRQRGLTVLRSEANRAYQDSSLTIYRQHPFVIGVRWQLSASHVVFDECDLKASLDLGLGPGVYPVEAVPLPDHPNGLCTISPVLASPEEAATARPARPTPLIEQLVGELRRGPLSRTANRLGRTYAEEPALAGMLMRQVVQDWWRTQQTPGAARLRWPE